MPERRFHAGRHAGVVVPLFSMPSRASWGVGEIPDLLRLGAWLEDAGLDFVQLLPVNEMAGGQSSPYMALSAMAIDPLFIAPSEIEGCEPDVLGEEERTALEAARRSPGVDYRTVRRLKSQAFARGFERFERTGSTGSRALDDFVARESWWLDGYTLFRALHQENQGRSWLEWEEGIRHRHPQAIAAARERLAREIRYYSWLQWHADDQWARVRREGRIGLLGDFPFMVGADSADVWMRQDEFRLDASVGVPPDAFSETGQDWGLPVYRWDVMERNGYEWLGQRTRRCAELYDGFRVDHLVGFYRTYFRDAEGQAAFIPLDEQAQIAQGERLLDLFASAGARIVAEDLGTVPDFVRHSLERKGVAGLKVLRWEREWHQEGQPFRDPAGYPPRSVAMSGTHDTGTLAEWWDEAPAEERQAAAAIPALGGALDRNAPFSDVMRDALLEALYSAGSDLVLLPLQDVFGWRDRINTPAVVDDVNWTWQLPWPVDTLPDRPEARERAAFLRELARRHGR